MYAQHGDLLLKKKNKIPEGAERLNTLTLLKGGNGHDHRFTDHAAVSLFKAGETIYADVTTATDLVHDEHKPITIPEGVWEMDRVREHDYAADEMRRVVD